MSDQLQKLWDQLSPQKRGAIKKAEELKLMNDLSRDEEAV
jgi:hypothetical protein